MVDSKNHAERNILHIEQDVVHIFKFSAKEKELISKDKLKFLFYPQSIVFDLFEQIHSP